jgi:hypothetical protein
LTAAGIAVSPVFPSVERMAGLVPPLAFLLWIPNDVLEILWSAPAFFGHVVAWRVRALRGDLGSDWLASGDATDQKRLLFEAAAVPVAMAAVALAIGIEVAAPVHRLLAGLPGGWPSVGPVLLAASRSLVVVAVVAGVMSVHRSVSSAFGKLLGAGFMLFGLRMAIAFTVPWVTAWWSHLPIPFIERFSGERSPGAALFLFNLAVASIAWVVTLGKAEDSPFWSAAGGDGEAESPPSEPDLPPLPPTQRDDP